MAITVAKSAPPSNSPKYNSSPKLNRENINGPRAHEMIKVTTLSLCIGLLSLLGKPVRGDPQFTGGARS